MLDSRRVVRIVAEVDRLVHRSARNIDIPDLNTISTEVLRLAGSIIGCKAPGSWSHRPSQTTPAAADRPVAPLRWRPMRSTSEVQDEHEQEQHEGGRVGLLRGRAFAGGGVAVDVAGERRAGPPQQPEDRGPSSAVRCAVVSPSSSTTIAVSPMMRLTPSVTPVAMFERTLGSSTRRIVVMRVLPSAKAASRMCVGTACSPSRVAAKIGGSAISDIIAPAAMNERPIDAAAGGAEGEGPHEAQLEDDQAEQRDHDVGRAGDDLDARLDHAREPGRAAVLGDPDRAARPRAGPPAGCRWRSAARCPRAGPGNRRCRPG